MCAKFTGEQLFNAQNGVVTFATLRTRHCLGAPTRWLRAKVDADLPEGTQARLYVRSAESEAQLDDAGWLGPFDGPEADLSAGPGPVADASDPDDIP